MDLVPFDAAEMEAVDFQPGFPGAPSRTVWKSPITPGENLVHAFTDKQCMFLPSVLDAKTMNAYIIPDNRARAGVTDGGEPFIPGDEGEKDAFGIVWLYEPELNGSMVRPGNPLLEDASEWRDVIQFPNPDEWDWDVQMKRSSEYLVSDLYVYSSTILTGFFERLISFMDFENAAVALVDDDQKPYVHEIFDALCNLYCKYVDHFVDDFGVKIVEIHDDRGSQASTLIAEDTLREMILPYIKRMADYIHSKGAYMSLHSCGRIGCFVPAMIDAGVDMWMGQSINDKKDLVEKYGDKIAIQVEVPEVGEDASDEEVWEAAEKFADDYIIPGKPVVLSIYSAALSNKPLMTEALYQISRKKLCGAA